MLEPYLVYERRSLSFSNASKLTHMDLILQGVSVETDPHPYGFLYTNRQGTPKLLINNHSTKCYLINMIGGRFFLREEKLIAKNKPTDRHLFSYSSRCLTPVDFYNT